MAGYIGDVTMILWRNTATNKFVSYTPTQPVNSPTNISVEGGKGYIIVMRVKKEVIFEGRAWQNTL
ncbi:TPA: hypothetical protein EYP66_05060 [Candidatus Poribacteria bacterium]|nr:hypothetical protein [Candidatus Poribacteria bacterium]